MSEIFKKIIVTFAKTMILCLCKVCFRISEHYIEKRNKYHKKAITWLKKGEKIYERGK